jgi:hypothetical protein
MLENELKRIADALEKIANIGSIGSVTIASELVTAKKEKAKKAELTPAQAIAAGPAQTVTKEALADALRELVLKKTPVVAKEILTKYGAARLSEIKEADYAACYADLQKATNV